MDGLPFAPDAAIREVDGEAVILIGGGRALLMQIAHPLVAQGVAEHSEWRANRYGRLLRTLRPMFAIVFGNGEELRDAARGVNAVHRGVTGAGYHAGDPELLLWVHATLVDTALQCHRRFVGALPPEREARYYDDTRLVGRLLGVPESLLPDDLDAFNAYLEATINELEVSETARTIARELYRPAPPFGPLIVPWRELTAGLLPPRLREAYGMPWDPVREALIEGASGLSRAVWPRLPRALRRPPALLLPPSACRRYGAPTRLGAYAPGAR
ncbi:MAG: oxygenase MpaB family protein [Chloroflexota bacterium]|nr:oxygenase MpaB family protein [Chloroflexota bacterium]